MNFGAWYLGFDNSSGVAKRSFLAEPIFCPYTNPVKRLHGSDKAFGDSRHFSFAWGRESVVSLDAGVVTPTIAKRNDRQK
ncbi:hypothetical protein IFM47457_01642 [Aspergillus lentulus]|nr:hypothetical protein IFM47457_01642 [Aspergillus lentulus]